MFVVHCALVCVYLCVCAYMHVHIIDLDRKLLLLLLRVSRIVSDHQTTACAYTYLPCVFSVMISFCGDWVVWCMCVNFFSSQYK